MGELVKWREGYANKIDVTEIDMQAIPGHELCVEGVLLPLPSLHVHYVERVFQKPILHFIILLTAGRERRGGVHFN